MSTELSGSTGPDEDWPDEDWPREDRLAEGWSAGGPSGPGMAPRAPARGGGPGRRGRRRLLSFALLALAAMAAGAALTLALTRAISAAPSSSPASGPATAPSGGRHSLGALAPGSSTGPGLPPGAMQQLMLIGMVRAVSGTSITIGGNGPSVSAAITSATRVSGRAGRAAAIRVGDQVLAQITVRHGQAVATAIRDPATAPAGAGSLS